MVNVTVLEFLLILPDEGEVEYAAAAVLVIIVPAGVAAMDGFETTMPEKKKMAANSRALKTGAASAQRRRAAVPSPGEGTVRLTAVAYVRKRLLI